MSLRPYRTGGAIPGESASMRSFLGLSLGDLIVFCDPGVQFIASL
jgi:hypothetical protein